MKELEGMNISEEDLRTAGIYPDNYKMLVAVQINTYNMDRTGDEIFSEILEEEIGVSSITSTFLMDSFHPENKEKLAYTLINGKKISEPLKYEVLSYISTLDGGYLPEYHKDICDKFGFPGEKGDASHLFSLPLQEREILKNLDTVFVVEEIEIGENSTKIKIPLKRKNTEVFKQKGLKINNDVKIKLSLSEDEIMELASQNLAHLPAKYYYETVYKCIAKIYPPIEVSELGTNRYSNLNVPQDFPIVPYEDNLDISVFIYPMKRYTSLRSAVKDEFSEKFGNEKIENMGVEKIRKYIDEILFKVYRA